MPSPCALLPEHLLLPGVTEETWLGGPPVSPHAAAVMGVDIWVVAQEKRVGRPQKLSVCVCAE